jgi:rSAM/selenodomain-associated transferase 1
MKTVGISIICKTPEPGKSKTRLSPPLSPEQCASISECFIRDLASNIQTLCDKRAFTGYAVYTPVGSEDRLRRLIPDEFGLIPQSDGDLGARLFQATKDILARGHDAAFILSSDSPTLPMDVLEAAVDELLQRDCVALGPAIDGGYTFIGLTHAHERLFEDIPWSTEDVHRLTLERAGEIPLPVFNAPRWYDVDEAATFELLQSELVGDTLPAELSGHARMPAPATQAYLTSLGRAAGSQPHRSDFRSDDTREASGR